MKNINTLILLLLLASTGFGQSLSPRVTATAGGRATGGGVSLFYTIGETFNTKLSVNNKQLTQGQQQPEIDLRTTLTGNVFCAGSIISVPYNATGYVDAANTFTAQLSDANGNFINAVNIGSVSALASGTITATIPSGAAGDNYRIRVVSANPIRKGSDNGFNIKVSALPATAVSGVTQPTCSTPTGSINITSPIGANYTYTIGGVYQQSSSFASLVPGNYNVNVKNQYGCISETSTATINPSPYIPAQPDAVEGEVNVCRYVGTTESVLYTVPPTPGATQYIWYLPSPSTMKIVDELGNEIAYNSTTGYTTTNTIRLKFTSGFSNLSNAQKYFTVKAKSICGISATGRTKYLTAQYPVTPSLGTSSGQGICAAITDPVGITQLTTPMIYRVPKVVSASGYNWFVDASQASNVLITHPNGAGAEDTVVTVLFTNAFSSCNLNVQALNNCGTSGIRTFALTKTSPFAPGLISGPTSICTYMAPNGQNAAYSIPSTTGVLQYNWGIPSGSLNVTGQGTRNISFLYPSGYSGGTISVTAQNACGTSSARSITTSRNAPSNPTSIDVSPLSSCPGRIIDYSIARMPTGATYLEWTVPAGGAIMSGQGTTSIRVAYGSAAVSGAVAVKSRNECMIYSSSSAFVAVKLAICSAIAGTIPESGTKSATNNLDVKLFPNPTASSFNLQVSSSIPTSEKISVRLLDVQGRQIKSMMVMPNETINLGAELKSGAYMLEVKQGGVTKTVRAVKY